MSGRSTDGVSSPIDLIIKYARYHSQALKTGTTHQLYFFSKDKGQCEELLMFGGHVYRQNGGYGWVCGKAKHLVAIYKLLPPEPYENESLNAFAEWVREILTDF